jgi:hypothetical protein
MEKPPVGAGTSPSPMLVFYIPPCRKTFTAWRNVKCQHRRGTKCSRTNRVLFYSQNCNFPEESFILISFCCSVLYKRVQCPLPPPPHMLLFQSSLCHHYMYVTTHGSQNPDEARPLKLMFFLFSDYITRHRDKQKQASVQPFFYLTHKL